MQEKWKYFSAKMSQPPPQISEVPNVQYQLQPILVKVRIKKKTLLLYSYIFVYLKGFIIL